ncbi:methyltransferase domain-containing protein [Lewinella sp. IMCC34183]|uniref:methyltransferase domain-containing protein n=1 Tax=Lewinella sp. IMCC34183 TaxID=2248762 RepID=UPI000E286502|nr:methyltransferase domain-containing protein [Lewinella sp. IMCC34183]
MNAIEIQNIVKEYIALERLDSAFLVIEENIQNQSDLYDSFILAKSRISRHKIKDRNGTLDYEQIEIYNNAVRSDILKIVNQIEDQDLIKQSGQSKRYSSILQENKEINEKLKQFEQKEVPSSFRTDIDNFYILGGSSTRAENFEKEMNNLLRFIHSVVEPSKDQENFIFAVFSGLISSLRRGLIPDGRNVLYLDTDFYPSILRLVSPDDNIYAIADLTDETEKIWDTIPDAQTTAVKERTFLLPWSEFFHPQYLSRFYDLAKIHTDFYSIKFSHIPISTINHEEFQDAIGNDLLVAPKSNIVCYYVNKNDKKLLKVVFDASIADKAMKEYEWITKDAIPFTSELKSFSELRKSWIQANDFGCWVWKNKSVEDRGPKYVNFYDIHIRCWIWRYEELIKNTVRLLKSEIIELLHTPVEYNQMKILEIGYGTGALTVPAIRWINGLNKSYEHKSPDAKVRYFGIDREGDVMTNIMMNKVTRKIEPHRFVKGIAWDDMHETLVNIKFDVIVMSLVLHDILSGDTTNKFESFISTAYDYLSESGVILITDIFHSSKEEIKEKEIKFWKENMQETGLSSTQIDNFILHNMDMIDTITREDLVEISENNGFNIDVRNIPVAYGAKSPFKIVVLKKSA